MVLLHREMSIPPRLPTEVWDLIHKINTIKAKMEVNKELLELFFDSKCKSYCHSRLCCSAGKIEEYGVVNMEDLFLELRYLTR